MFCIISTSVHAVFSTAYEQILLFQGINPQTIRVSLNICAYWNNKERKETLMEKGQIKQNVCLDLG